MLFGRWGGGGGEIGGRRWIRWRAWHHLCIPKEWGGMSFKSLKDFNVTMLNKQAWRIIQNPMSLLARVYKAKYFPRWSFSEAGRGYNPSFIWSSLVETQTVIKRNNRWSVGNGR